MIDLPCVRISLVIGLLTYFGTFASAEEPYIAEFRYRVFEVDRSGQRVEKESVRIIEARDSNGSRYTAQDRPTARSITLSLKPTATTYLYTEGSRSVRLMNRVFYDAAAMMKTLSPEKQKEAMSRQATYGGISCMRSPAFTIKNGKEVQIGEVCMSLELNLRVNAFRDVELPGKRLHIEEELISIRRGAEPSAVWFQLPLGAEIVENTPPAAR